MRYSRDRSWHAAERADYLRAAIQRDRMTLNDLERYATLDPQTRHAIRLAKRRIARNTKELGKG